MNNPIVIRIQLVHSLYNSLESHISEVLVCPHHSPREIVLQMRVSSWLLPHFHLLRILYVSTFRKKV